jgi:ornithine cyclodeaminase/alanine dehydrogenase-like protein (mu-crystallin family)
MPSPLYLTEREVSSLIDMRGVITTLEAVFRAQQAGDARNSPRQRAQYWGSRLNIMSAGRATGRFAFKAYAGTKAPTAYHLMLYDGEAGLLAIIEAGALGKLRTGAATGLAIDKLAPHGDISFAMIGAGRQARAQIAAAAAVRGFSSARVFARDGARLHAFCDELSRELGRAIEPAKSARDCVRDAQVIVTATNAQSPVLQDDWIGEEAFIAAMGANAPTRRELEKETFLRARLIVTDDADQARLEAGDIAECVTQGAFGWSDVATLASIVGGETRRPTGLAIFKSLGAALEDLATAELVYELATARGVGLPLR